MARGATPPNSATGQSAHAQVEALFIPEPRHYHRAGPTHCVQRPVIQTLTTTDALAEFCARATDGPYVTVDTEFLRERTYYAQLCLVQLALPGADPGDAVLVDPLDTNLSLDPLCHR